MDSFEFNKIMMAILGTVFIVMSLNFLSDGLFHAEVPEEQGYAVEVADSGEASGAEEDTGPAFDPVAPLLASADVSAGEKSFKKCAACHTAEEGGANKVGPALWGVVERAIATVDGFSYSGALKAYGEGKTWTYDELNGFLWKPKTFVKGTSMGFGGLKKVEERADVIAYLRSLSNSPAPLPAASAVSVSTDGTNEDAPEPAATGESSQPASSGEAQTENAVEPASEEATQTEEPASTEPASEAPSDGESGTEEPASEESTEPEQPESGTSTTTD